MILERGNIRFVRLREEDAELVRKWRNSPSINQFMEYRGYITPGMQKEWFRSINNDHNMYFIVEVEGRKVGLINARNIDWEKTTMETGVFFWDEKIYSTPVPLLAILTFAEVGIRMFNLHAYARILRGNTRAIRYNQLMGFELCDGQENVENQLYYLSRERYLERSAKIRKAFYAISGSTPLTLLMEPEDYDIGIAGQVEKVIAREYVLESKETEQGRLYRCDLL